MLEGQYAVTTVRGGKHLHVEFLGELENGPPDQRLHRVVQAVLDLVDQQDAIAGVAQRQDDAEHAVDAVAVGAERYAGRKALAPDDSRSAAAAAVTADHRYGLDVGGHQLKRLEDFFLNVGEFDFIPEHAQLAGISRIGRVEMDEAGQIGGAGTERAYPSAPRSGAGQDGQRDIPDFLSGLYGQGWDTVHGIGLG